MKVSLANLEKIEQLKAEPYNQTEFNGLLIAGKKRLKDAQNKTLEFESRFDLAYNAAHSLALAALRRKNYRSTSRYIVFQALQHTTNLSADKWKILSICHNRRNLAEYEGYFEVDEQLLNEMIAVTQSLLDLLEH